MQSLKLVWKTCGQRKGSPVKRDAVRFQKINYY